DRDDGHVGLPRARGSRPRAVRGGGPDRGDELRAGEKGVRGSEDRAAAEGQVEPDRGRRLPAAEGRARPALPDPGEGGGRQSPPVPESRRRPPPGVPVECGQVAADPGAAAGEVNEKEERMNSIIWGVMFGLAGLSQDGKSPQEEALKRLAADLPKHLKAADADANGTLSLAEFRVFMPAFQKAADALLN